MNGFAPLIEGFLAFALTMLALTTAVSAIVGALHHLRRRHARGLRDMVRLLYLHEVVPLLAGTRQPVTRGIVDALTREPEGIVAAITRLATSFDKGVRSLFQRTPKEENTEAKRKATEIAGRAEFIYDMTFMPVPDVVEKLETKGELYWRTTLASAERLVGRPWYMTLLHPKRVARRWMTLRYGLEALTDAEFLDRLAKSEVGTKLKAKLLSKELVLTSWEELAAQLLKRFQTIGGASSETFARYSRGWSFVVGFLLATLLNVDSLDLLNSYLTDPEIRQQVIAQSDEIRAQRAPAPDTAGVSALAPGRARLDAASTQLTSSSKNLIGTVETLTSTLGSAERQRVAAALQAGLQGVLDQVQGVQEGLGALDADVTEAERRIRGATRSLTTSFPIGWKRFPNCAADSPDPRCGGRMFELAQQKESPWWHSISVLVNDAFPERFKALWTPIHDRSLMLANASTEEPAYFNQWLLGVMLTTVLLGLGTSYWVKVVSSALNLRRWVTKSEEGTQSGGASAQTSAGGSQTAIGTHTQTLAGPSSTQGVPHPQVPSAGNPTGGGTPTP